MPAYSVERLIMIGERVILYDGMDSQFSIRLSALLSEHGKSLVESIGVFISSGKCSQFVASEFLTQLENYSDIDTEDSIYKLTVSGLSSKYLEVRDAAMNALGSMENPEAIAPLREAIKREKNNELREDMKVILIELLEDTDAD